MPATVQIVRKTGVAPGTPIDITGINTRANAEDLHSVASTVNPIRVPSVPGTNYSFWVTTRLNCTVAPAGTIDNIRWFTDGANTLGAGIGCIAAKASQAPDAGYRQATGSIAVTGDELNLVNHDGLDAAPVDAFTFIEAAPLAVSGSISNPSTGQFGDHVVYQITVDETAGPGPSGQETITWRYDET